MANHYESEITQFLNQLKNQKPHLESEQKKGRLLLWDKIIDRNLWQGFNQSRVPQKPYVYHSDDKHASSAD
jgi:Protein of unknown function (DUF3460)